MLVGCAKEEKTVNRAVFAWEGAEEADKQLLENYRIDTIFMDINHYSAIPGYNIYLLAEDPSWEVDDMEQVVEEAEEKRADGVLFDIEGNYVTLASNLSLLESDLPIYVCMPFWLEEDVQEKIIQEADGVVVMNYSKGNETPVECARLQGFPDWWCSDLGTDAPTEEDIRFWSEVWETHRKVMETSQKPKSEKQVIKWLKDPYSDSAEYKLWGNGVSLPIVFFVLSGIVWAASKE